MRLLILIILPLMAGLIAYITPGITGKNTTLGIQLLSLGVAFYNLREVVLSGSYSMVVGNYDRSAGIVLTADTFSSVMIMLTASIFFMCTLYARNNAKLESHFFFLYLVLQSCMVALFITRDLFNIFVIVEVCTIVIAILIMYKNERSLYDSLLYLMNNTVAMIFFVFGVAILYKNLASLNLDVLREGMGDAQISGSYIAAYAMLLTGISFKCALAPMFTWLPRAHAARGVPTVVSAVLSALYIKTGIFVFIRVREVFHPLIDIDGYLLFITIATSLTGAFLAMRQKNIKLILAYSTISQIGLIMSGILSGNPVSETGALYHLVNHVIFKSTLFLCAGIYIKHYGHKDITKMRGAFRSMPMVSTACLLALFGVTGAPLFNGSISKYFIEYGIKGSYIYYLISIINTATIIYFFKFFMIMPGRACRSADENSSHCIYKTVTVLFMGAVSLLGGIFSEKIMRVIFVFDGIVDIRGYLIKGIVYLLTMGGCYLFYRYQGGFKPLVSGGKMSPSFNGISIMTCTFFIVTTMVIYINVRI